MRYLFDSLDANRPGLWLPAADYGLAAGPNDFTGFEAGSRQAVLRGEFGTFCTIRSDWAGLRGASEFWSWRVRVFCASVPESAPWPSRTSSSLPGAIFASSTGKGWAGWRAPGPGSWFRVFRALRAWRGSISSGTASSGARSRRPTGELVPVAKVPSVLAEDASTLFQVYGTGVTKTVVDVTGQTFTRAMRVVTSQKPAQAFNFGVLLRTAVAVAANDNLLARFWVRQVPPPTGTAQVPFNFEQAGGTFDKSVQVPVPLVEGAWQFRTVKFKSRAAYAAGGAEVSFWTGYGVQTVEIGGVEVLNYRGTTPP